MNKLIIEHKISVIIINNLEKDMTIETESIKILKSFFGFNTFKGKQKVCIESILQGKDVFVVMPTGGGKSLCYQLPSLILEGTSIIISPLIALMKNQVDSIRSNSKDRSIAHFFNSSLTEKEKKEVINDLKEKKTKILYVAPETICNPKNLELFKKINISFFAIDEAHCISEWGHDFRPEYKKIKSAINNLTRKPIMALTATATKKVQEEIKRNLGILEADFFISSFNRKNLYYEIVKKKEENPEKGIIQYIKKNDKKSGIIYCLTRKKVDELTNLLNLNNIYAVSYHAGLERDIRNKNQDKFLKGECEIIVATIAFGMGIDKPNIRFILHFDIPKSLEGYYQETGRAGRDGGYSECILFFSMQDLRKFEKIIEKSSSKKIAKKLINEVLVYCSLESCRREYILNYFDESFQENESEKNCCDNCSHDCEMQEGKDKLYELLNYCATEDYKISDFINATESEKISHRSTIISKAISKKYLIRNENQNLKINKKGLEFIENPSSFLIPKKTKRKENIKQKSTSFNKELMLTLKKLRQNIASKSNLPPFVIFQDIMLEDMCKIFPTSIEELSNINGISLGKAEKYGELFISEINSYVSKNKIEKNLDFKIKSNINKSALKVFIIQQIDKKVPFEDIGIMRKMDLEELIKEIEKIVESGTKVNINYELNKLLSKEEQEELYDYFLNEAKNDSIINAKEYFEDSYEESELKIMRIKFLSELAN